MDDLIGALRLVGLMSDHEVEEEADRIVNGFQEREGMVATIQHRSDGTQPTTVYSVGPGNATTRLDPSMWEKLMEGCGGMASEEAPPSQGGLDAQVQAVTNALLAATRDMSTNTGGAKWRPPQAKTKKLLTTEEIVGRMRVSYSALRAAKLDAGLRQLILSELMT